MKEILRKIFLILIVDIVHIQFVDSQCTHWSCDEDNNNCDCLSCEYGYYLKDDDCEKVICEEGEGKDSCYMCFNGECISCVSDDYAVYIDYNKYVCRKEFLKCGNNTIKNCEKCSVSKGVENGNCEKCYKGFYPSKNICYVDNDSEISKLNKFVLFFMILMILIN